MLDQLKEERRPLVASGLVVPSRASLAPAYAFRHALGRDAAYASMLRSEQQTLHARIAAVITEDFPDAAEAQPEMLAQHFEAAGLGEQAVPHLVAAARLASRRSGFAEALTRSSARSHCCARARRLAPAPSARSRST